ncbi:hypothetical protein pipiens_006594 [Culex pipiens pipiens]|uniref:Ion transport domain-containing protein n=1 Tax=Culex pipiens pipiens TaxID=38569 RepID=A0ABD1DPE5_CULPP
MGLQIYMGVLTQKCIKEFPTDGSWGNLTHENWERHHSNDSNWYFSETGDTPLCGNSSGAGQCEEGYVLRSAGPWHMLFFIVIIFLGSFYLVNLILAIVAMSYDELQKKAEEEEAAEEEALREAEEAAAAKQAKLEAHAAAAAAAANPEIAKSPSDFSCHSYELFVGQEKGNDDNNKEKMSIRSEGLESVSEITRTTAPTATAAGTAKARKVSAQRARPLPEAASVRVPFDWTVATRLNLCRRNLPLIIPDDPPGASMVPSGVCAGAGSKKAHEWPRAGIGLL